MTRFYSTESQANSEAKKEEQKKEEANKEAKEEVKEAKEGAKEGAEAGEQTESVEEQLKKQLEAKNKEILDLKVCTSEHTLPEWCTNENPRIGTFAPWPNSATCRSGPSATWRLPGTLPFSGSRPICSSPSTTLNGL